MPTRSLSRFHLQSYFYYRNRQQNCSGFSLPRFHNKHVGTGAERGTRLNIKTSSLSTSKTALDPSGLLRTRILSTTSQLVNSLSLNRFFTSFSIASSGSRYSNNFTNVRNMSSKHLATGSPCPPLQDGKIRLYNMRYCPFAERALLVAEAKGLPYDVVNCNLKNKPEWLLEKNPEGKVPVLETKEGVILYESLVVSEYLDEVYSQRPLSSKDPYKKATDKIFIEKFGSVISTFYKILFAIRDDEPETVKKERISNFVQGLKPFEAELSKRGTLFFGGDEPGMLDYMIWPWIERIPVIKSKMPGLFDYEAAKQENPNLEKWRQAMKKDKAVEKLALSTEVHQIFIDSFLSGTPNYYDVE